MKPGVCSTSRQEDIGARWRYDEYLAALPPAAGGVHD
jgi:hypothetical protein